MRFGIFYQATKARRAGRGSLRKLTARAGLPALRSAARDATRSARDSMRGGGQAGLRRLLGRMSGQRLEQIFGSTQAQRALFAMMTREFDPARAAGFDGAIAYDLGLADGTRRCWTIEVRDGHVRVHQDGDAAGASLTIRVPLGDFARVLTTAGSFDSLILDGRMTMDGDLALAGRLPEMFGAAR
ncbi:MAG TPA: SCP2 sterol-binding domain-containing protein [Streptosporangiaceae bacterium]|nr:SCP2 sterol-binding domain-containing protein [Streptosporangiaceae bacterium]